MEALQNNVQGKARILALERPTLQPTSAAAYFLYPLDFISYYSFPHLLASNQIAVPPGNLVGFQEDTIRHYAQKHLEISKCYTDICYHVCYSS